MIERTFRCDAPDCEHHMRDCITTVPPCPGWIVAYETAGEGRLEEEPLIFCCWDCCMKYSATHEPPETIPFGSAGGDSE